MKAYRPRLEIAGVAFAVSSNPSVSFRNHDPLYRPFFRTGFSGNRPADIRLRLVRGPLPKLDHLNKLFDTEESWSMRGERDSRWISLHPDRHPEPLWVARFDRGASRVRLWGDPWPLGYPLDQLLMMYHLAGRDGLLAHAAGLILDGRAVIFTGTSGAGKSTLARLFDAGREGKVLSDERMVLRRAGQGFKAFGTPWAGTAGIARNGSAPLAAVVFLKHGRANRVLPVAPRDALDRLLPLCSIPWYEEALVPRIILLCKNLVASVPAYEFRFKADRSAPAAFLKFISAPASL
jgi:hypothetical protein